MGVRTAQHFNYAGVWGDTVFHIAGFGLDHFGRIGFWPGFTNHREIVAESGGDSHTGLRIVFTRHRQFDHLIILLPTRITTEQAGQRIVNLFTGRIRDSFQQFGDDQCGRRIVITGLHDADIHHRLLYQAQRIPLTE